MIRLRLFVRILVRSVIVRRGATLTALLGILTAAAVATAMLNLYADFDTRMQKEFRGYGSNILLTSSLGPSHPLPPEYIARVDSLIGPGGAASPFGYVVATSENGSAVVVSGTDFDRVRRLNSWWSVTAWPGNPGDALFGQRASAVLKASDHPVTLYFQGKPLRVAQRGVLSTGAAEESRVYVSMQEFFNWTGLGPSSIEIAVNGSKSEINHAISAMHAAMPDAQVTPIRQAIEAEAGVLRKSRAVFFFCTALIIATVGLCMLGTLTASVLERSKDFALMKALGASSTALNAFFIAEAAALGLLGAIFGVLAGIGIARWISRANFHAPMDIRYEILPIVLLGSLVTLLVAAIFPLTLLKNIEPAEMLKGN